MKKAVLVCALQILFSSVCYLAPVSSQALEPGDKMQLERPSPASKAPAPIKPGAVIAPKIPVKMQPTIDGKTPVVRAPLTAKGRVFKVGSITRQQADQLQDSDLIEYQGKQYDVGTLRSNKQKADAAGEATMRQKASQARSEFEAYRKNFSQSQMSKLAAVNVKIDSAAKLLSRRVQTSGTAPTPAQPTITETSVTITPGARVLIVGSGFGSVRGTAFLTTGNISEQLAIESWADNNVVGMIPAGIVGVPDGRGTVIVKAGGAESNHWPVVFTAAREVVMMNGKQGLITVDNCNDFASIIKNRCQNRMNAQKIISTIRGEHYGDNGRWAGSGTDIYSVSLINGWTFDNAKTWWAGSGAATVKGFIPSASSLKLLVDWNFDVYWGSAGLVPFPLPGSVEYFIELYIVGPKGVPYY